MFKRPPHEPTQLDKVLDEITLNMVGTDEGTEEYSKMTESFVKLYKLKAEETPRRVTPDTMAVVIGNLLGIIMIVGHERAHVVTSKALTFVRKI